MKCRFALTAISDSDNITFGVAHESLHNALTRVRQLPTSRALQARVEGEILTSDFSIYPHKPQA